MSISSLLPFLVLMLIAWLWLAGARAREFATALAKRHCQQRGLQFLDDTVAMARIGLRWTNEGLRMRRMYRFDFSQEGAGRRIGFIVMLGTRLEHIDDGLMRPSPSRDEQPPTEPPKPAAPGSDGERKVIPFRRKEP